MGNLLTLREERVGLQNVSWETYEHLLADHLEAPAPFRKCWL